MNPITDTYREQRAGQRSPVVMQVSDKDNNKKPPAHQMQATKLCKGHLPLIFTPGATF